MHDLCGAFDCRFLGELFLGTAFVLDPAKAGSF
jgi:hypothetical protein